MVPSFLQVAKDHGWTIDTIGGLLEKQALLGLMDGNHGNLYPRSEEFADEGVPYISATNFLNNRVNYDKVKHLPEVRASKLKKGIAKHGDVLFAHNATVGPVALLETQLPRVILSTSVTYHRCNPDQLHNKFWLAYLESAFFQRQVERIMRQTTRSQVPITAQKELWATLPPLSEQRKIADILSTWDAAIEKTEALLATAKAQKRALMQSLLTGRRRFPEFERQPWKEVRLGDVTTVIVSNVDKKAKGGERPVRLCNYTDVYKRDEIRPSQSFMEATATPAQIKKFGLNVGDVIITKDSEKADDIAMPTYVAEVADDLVCGYHLAIVRPGSQVDGRFLKHYFELPYTRYYFGTRANGAIRFGLTIDGIEQAVVNLPPIEEQRRIASVIRQTEAEVASLTTDITKLRIEKKALMQQLLTGKRRVVADA